MQKIFLLSLLAALPVLAVGPCPTPDLADIGYKTAGAGANAAGGCNTVITFNANGSVTTTVPNSDPYDGVEDTLVGVVNNSGSAITSFNLSGSNLFGFDGDGVCSGFYFSVATNCTGSDASGYGGPGVSFTIANSNNGTVKFAGTGIAANGGTAWFSLEESPTLSIVVTPSVPEPASVVLFGSALGVCAFYARRRRKNV